MHISINRRWGLLILRGGREGEGGRGPAPRRASAGRSRGPDGSGETGAKAGACRAGEGEIGRAHV